MLCQCPLTCHVATQYVLAIPLYFHSQPRYNNSIGDEGAVAISAAIKTMTNLQTL